VRAAVYRGPGDLVVEDVAEPVGPAGDELRIEVSKAAICGTDASEWLHGPVLARPPVILGHEFVGRVVETGSAVSSLKPGDRVVSGAGASCGSCRWCLSGRTNLCQRYYTLGLHVNGGLAEQVVAPASTCFRVPDEVSDTAAAMVQPLAVALHAVRRAGLVQGDSCVVIGAGGIGAFVVAAAASRGADPLVVVDVDEERLDVARKLGATELVDARSARVVEVIEAVTSDQGADVVIEATGSPGSPAVALGAARKGGVVVIVGLQPEPLPVDLLSLTTREIDVRGTLAHVCDVDVPESIAIVAGTSIADVVLDREIDLGDLVEEGIRPLAERRAKGKIIVGVARG